jgi:hypothetical protein
MGASQLLDVTGDVDRLDPRQVRQALVFAPGGKLRDGPEVRLARMAVAAGVSFCPFLRPSPVRIPKGILPQPTIHFATVECIERQPCLDGGNLFGQVT